MSGRAPARNATEILPVPVARHATNIAGCRVGKNSPYYEIWVKADGDYCIAVSVQSADGSDVLVFFDPEFAKPTKLDLPPLAAGPRGFTPLATGPDGQGLDYLRDGLFPIAVKARIPNKGAGMPLVKLLDAQIERAKADDGALLLACGELFRGAGPDPTFGFSPEQRIHDIHMMQGNYGKFADDNRVNGDGALFIRYSGGETAALFVRFSAQEIATNDQSGTPMGRRRPNDE